MASLPLAKHLAYSQVIKLQQSRGTVPVPTRRTVRRPYTPGPATAEHLETVKIQAKELTPDAFAPFGQVRWMLSDRSRTSSGDL